MLNGMIWKNIANNIEIQLKLLHLSLTASVLCIEQQQLR